jgi:hypothetical protein
MVSFMLLQADWLRRRPESAFFDSSHGLLYGRWTAETLLAWLSELQVSGF